MRRRLSHTDDIAAYILSDIISFFLLQFESSAINASSRGWAGQQYFAVAVVEERFQREWSNK